VAEASPETAIDLPPVSAPETGVGGWSSFSTFNQWLLGLGLMLALLIVYWPALSGHFIWDDDTHISANGALRTGRGLWEIWFKPGATCQYYPLTFSVFWLEYQLWGLHTPGYHLVNVLLHGTVAILLWQVLRRLKVRGAWLAGAIFALHPVCVMSVAWMTELKNTLSATLALGAAWAYLRATGLGVYGEREFQVSSFKFQAGGSPGHDHERAGLDGRFYGLALGLFLMALWAKTAVSFLPVTLLLVAWWQGRRLNWRTVWPVLPMVGLAVLMGLVTIHVEQTSGGASGEQFHLSPLERVLISGRSFWFYLGKLFFPYHLTFIYGRWQVHAGVWWQYAFPLATGAALLAAWWSRRRLGRGALVVLAHFYVSTSLLVMLVTLYFTGFSYVSDHWQYFGCMSVIAAFAAGVAWAVDRAGRGLPALRPAVYGLLLAVLAVLTWRQCGMYQDSKTLWLATLARNPDSPLALNNYGSELMREEHVAEAIPEFVKVLSLKPGDVLAHYNLGTAYLRIGRGDLAARQYEQVLQLEPDAVVAHKNLGNLLLERGKVEEAIGHFQRILELHPNDPDAHYNLGNAYLRTSRLEDAIAEVRKVLELTPNDLGARCDLGNLLFQAGRMDEAASQFEKVEAMNPAYLEAVNDYIQMTWALATSPDDKVRNGAKALELAQKLVARSGGKIPVELSLLAAAQAESGHYEEAASTAERARQMAVQQKNTELAEALGHQLEFYRSGQPYHEKPAPPPAAAPGGTP
jgi:Flp pilus assembly protein TadD